MFTYIESSVKTESIVIKYSTHEATSSSTCPAEWILKDTRITAWTETLTLHAIAAYRDTTCQDYR